jgi:hypothetical protein
MQELRIGYNIACQNPASGAQQPGQVPFVYTSQRPTFVLNQTNPGAAGDEQTIPTTSGGTALNTGNVGTEGYLEVVNLDVTNYIQWGIVVSATFYPVGRLNPGEPSVFRLNPGVALYFLANTASVKIQYKLLEN